MNYGFPVALRRTVCAFLALMCALTSSVWLPAQVATDYYSDDQIKAALLLNFIRKTELPKGAGGEATSPLTIGVVGSSKLAAYLRKLGSTVVVQENAPDRNDLLKIRVVELREDGDLSACQAVYFGQNDKTSKSMLAKVSGSSVLTVGEGKEFTENGGLFGFERQNRKVRYWFSPEAMRRSGLRIGVEVTRLRLKSESKRGDE